MFRQHRAAAALASLSLALAVACGDPEPAQEQAAPPTAAPSLPQTAEDESEEEVQGQRGTERGSLPEGFPADVPIVSGAESTSWMAGMGAAGMLAAFEAASPPEDVYEFYLKQLPKSGWTLETRGNLEGSWSIHAVKGGRTLRLSVGEGDAGTEFVIAVSGAS